MEDKLAPSPELYKRLGKGWIFFCGPLERTLHGEIAGGFPCSTPAPVDQFIDLGELHCDFKYLQVKW